MTGLRHSRRNTWQAGAKEPKAVSSSIRVSEGGGGTDCGAEIRHVGGRLGSGKGQHQLIDPGPPIERRPTKAFLGRAGYRERLDKPRRAVATDAPNQQRCQPQRAASFVSTERGMMLPKTGSQRLFRKCVASSTPAKSLNNSRASLRE